MNPTQRRALRNGVVAFAVTAGIGFGVNALFGGTGGTSGDRAVVTPAASPSPVCTRASEQVATVDPDKAGSQLVGAVALSGSDVWAVGSTGSPDRPSSTLIEHWDGSLWVDVEAPDTGTLENSLAAVDATGPDDVWAVGSASSGAGAQPMILRWDGTSWNTAIAPNLLGGGALSGVVTVSPTDAWAVGYEGDTGIGSERALILHWDGTAWTVTATKAGGGKSLLRSVDAAAPDDVWAVGYHHQRPAAMHFDGNQWRWTTLDVRGDLFGVSAGAPDEAWAVGTAIVRWNGTAWKPVGTVRRKGELDAASMPSAAGLWAVGRRPAGDGVAALIQLFDGKRWSLVAGSAVAGSESLAAVSALPDGTAWAVGYRDTKNGRRTLALLLSSSCG